jgi:hypothetical protein
MATPKDGNPTWMLFILYFMPCDLMHQRYITLKSRFFSSEATQEQVGEEFTAFMLYWLASLFVVAEGWRELKLHDPNIDKMLGDHWDSLRRFRNAVFHFQPEDRKHKQFFDVDKLNWAESLHNALRAFFEAHERKPG